MKNTIYKYIGTKKAREKNIVHILYICIFVLFLGICAYELVLYLVSRYNFIHAVIAFVILTTLYTTYLYTSISATTYRKVRTTVLKYKYIRILSIYSEDIIYALFIGISCISLAGIYSFDRGIFPYAIYIFFTVFLLFTILGGRVNTSFSPTEFTQKTLLKIGVVSLLIFLVFLNSLIPIYEADVYRDMILLVGALIYILGFIICFTDALQKVVYDWKPRSFQNYTARNAYNILSVSCIAIAVILLVWRIENQESVADNHVVSIETERVLEAAPIIIDEVLNEPEEVFVTRLLSEVFNFGEESLFLGRTGQGVTQLQEALRLLGNYNGTISGNFDEATRDALIFTLQSECSWSNTTKGILGPQARACLYSLSVNISSSKY